MQHKYEKYSHHASKIFICIQSRDNGTLLLISVSARIESVFQYVCMRARLYVCYPSFFIVILSLSSHILVHFIVRATHRRVEQVAIRLEEPRPGEAVGYRKARIEKRFEEREERKQKK